MGTKEETTKSFIGQFARTVIADKAGYMEQFYSQLEGWNSTSKVVLKRTLPPRQSFLDRLIDMQVFFTEMTGKQPTKVIMGWKQKQELCAELDTFRMVMMPHKDGAGMLLGMNVVFESRDKLEVTC
jgi:hypothetical protein